MSETETVFRREMFRKRFRKSTVFNRFSGNDAVFFLDMSDMKPKIMFVGGHFMRLSTTCAAFIDQ